MNRSIVLILSDFESIILIVDSIIVDSIISAIIVYSIAGVIFTILFDFKYKCLLLLNSRVLYVKKSFFLIPFLKSLFDCLSPVFPLQHGGRGVPHHQGVCGDRGPHRAIRGVLGLLRLHPRRILLLFLLRTGDEGAVALPDTGVLRVRRRAIVTALLQLSVFVRMDDRPIFQLLFFALKLL